MLKCSTQQERRPQGHLKDYVCGRVVTLSSDHSAPKASACKAYPLLHYICYSKFSSTHKAFLAAINSHDEPTNYTEAVRDERWVEAMKKEINALQDNET